MARTASSVSTTVRVWRSSWTLSTPYAGAQCVCTRQPCTNARMSSTGGRSTGKVVIGPGVAYHALASVDTAELLPVALPVTHVFLRRVRDLVRPHRTLAQFGGHAKSHRAARDLHAVRHQRGGADERPAADDRAVQHDRTRPDERTVFHGASLEVGEVTDHAIGADDGLELA